MTILAIDPGVINAGNKPLRILAVDPGINCGWAHSCGISGTWNFSIKPNESSGMRLIRLRGKLDEIRHNVGVDLVVFENAHHTPGRTSAYSLLKEVHALLKVWCLDRGIELNGEIRPSEIKKHATGKGNANKDEMMKAARVKWSDPYPGIKIVDDNQADALWLLDFAQSQYAAPAL